MPSNDATQFIGVCNSCEQEIEFWWDFTKPEDLRKVDIGIDDDGTVYTWIRHPEGPTPECERYFSRVYAVEDK